MKCWIYKGQRRQETYLFLPSEDGTDQVPGLLLDQLGPLELVMELTLSPQQRLARANPIAVMEALRDRGFYLQLPPPDSPGIGRVQ